MSLQVPIRLKILLDNVLQGYVEALKITGGLSVSVNGPVATISGSSGGGGGDAATLQGHPASYFATLADQLTDAGNITLLQTELAALERSVADRTTMWDNLGVLVQSETPSAGITYSQWLLGMSGHWMWIKV